MSDHVPFPIATGERLLSRWEFRQFFEKQAAAYIQPDGSTPRHHRTQKDRQHGRGLLHPRGAHCAIGPVAFTACMHVDAAIPNFLIQEQVDKGLGAGLFKEDWQVVDGHITLPTKPGLGFEIDEQTAQQNRGIYEEELGGEFYYEDGSVADW
ncbi:MAG: enolase C-terminal domain-like protein [Caldilineaceae bacterium]